MSNVVPVFAPMALDAVPTELQSKKSWVVWKYLPPSRAGGKPRKVPFYTNGSERSGEQGGAADVSHMATFDQARRFAQNKRFAGVGICMFRSNGLVALDFDDCVVDGVIDSRILPYIDGTYSEFSPSGKGVRAFYVGELADGKDNTPSGGGFKVEVFCGTGYVTVTGNVTPECEMWGWLEIAPLTDAVIELHRKRFNSRFEDELSDDDFLAVLEPSMGWAIDQWREVLFDIPADCDRREWVRILSALHHETGGSDEGLELADEWSKTSEKYDGRRDVEGRWRSFGKNGGRRMTGRYMLKAQSEAKAHRKYEAEAEWRKKISETSTEFEIREKVCKQIAKDDRLGKIERESLAVTLSERFKALGNRKSLPMCREMVAEKREHKTREHDVLPKWAQGWVYVSDDDKFYRMDSDEWLSIQGFNARFNREMPIDESGNPVMTAAWACLNNYGMPNVTRGVYLPWGGPMFDLDGVKCVNTYRPSSVPEAADISKKGQKAIDVVVRHIDLLCGGRETVRETLISWAAFNVQNPGVKIRWAPLIKGVEGDGKSLLGSLMAAVMGRANVRNISPKVLGTDFTGWAEGAAIGVLEEIKLTGHNRYDILNALKPFITNDSVEIHRKGKDTYDAVNTMNYIAFTNHPDALPLTDTDRRWFVVFTPFATKADLSVLLGGADLGAYFDEVHAAIQSHRAELRQWLINYEVPSWFQPNGDAPHTAEKAAMVAMTSTDELDVAREVIEAGAFGVTANLLSSRCLVQAIQLADSDVAVATTSVNRLLTKLGFSQLPKKLKWRNEAHRVWVRGKVPSDNEAVRAVLDRSVTDHGDGSESVDDFFNLEPDLEP